MVGKYSTLQTGYFPTTSGNVWYKVPQKECTSEHSIQPIGPEKDSRQEEDETTRNHWCNVCGPDSWWITGKEIAIGGGQASQSLWVQDQDGGAQWYTTAEITAQH